jgi:hypothetical protein
VKHIKDPVHGYIDVPEDEISVINTSEFQRLRRIKQLGLSSTVYPSATHTRFSHSLGVMHISRQLSESIGLPEEDVKLNSMAGLLHDVGHLPYSHTLEKLYERKTGNGHEEISCQYIDKISEKADFPVDAQDVKDVIKGEYKGINVVSNEIDADRLDYLLRDSYNTGINLGQIEEATLIKFAERINGKIGFNHKSLKSVEQLLDARMKMNYSVYSHDTVNITETMLERATEFHINDTGDNLQTFIGMGDDEYNNLMINSDSKRGRNLFTYVRDRRLHKTCLLNSLHDIDSENLKILSNRLTPANKHEREIADMAGVERHKVLFSPPVYSEIDEFRTPIRTPTGGVRTLDKSSTKPASLRESVLLNQNLHIFCQRDIKDDVADAARDYLMTLEDVSSSLEF